MLDVAKKYGRIAKAKTEMLQKIEQLVAANRVTFDKDMDEFTSATNHSIYQAKRMYEQELEAAQILTDQNEIDEAAEVTRKAQERFDRSRTIVLKSIFEAKAERAKRLAEAKMHKVKALKSVASTVENSTAVRMAKKLKADLAATALAKAQATQERQLKQHKREELSDKMYAKLAKNIDAREAKELSTQDLPWEDFHLEEVPPTVK